jgi:hypothetical protein
MSSKQSRLLDAGFTSVVASAVHDEERMKQQVTIFFSLKELQRVFVWAIICTAVAVNAIARRPFFKLFFWMISGGAFKTPCAATITKIEKEFHAGLRLQIMSRLVAAKLVKSDGTGPVLYALPRYSISFDKSTTTIDDHQTITLNIHFFQGVDILALELCDKLNLGIYRFKVAGADGGVTRGTAENIAKFVIKHLFDFKLLPEEFDMSKNASTYDISAFCSAATTDNASSELCAVVELLRVHSIPCSNHSLALVLERAIKFKPTVEAGGVVGLQV